MLIKLGRFSLASHKERSELICERMMNRCELRFRKILVAATQENDDPRR